MRVVLVNPPLQNVVPAATPEYVDKNRGYTPPMGLLYIQAAINNSHHHSVFLDANLNNLTHTQTAQQILNYHPDVVGIQAMTFTMPDACHLAKEIKLRSKNTRVVIGGPHPTIYPHETANLPYIDNVIVGEGEFSFVDFLNYPTSNPIIGSTDLIPNLDLLSIPARSSSEYQRYSSVLAKHNPITVMITSRGCPFDCIFCNRMGRSYRAHSALYVLREFHDIAYLRIPEVFIHDDTFTLNRKRVIDICEGLIHRDYGITWEARTRVDCVDEVMLKLMKRAGCNRLSFGVESGSRQVLKHMQKDISLEMVRNVFKMCKDYGITSLADFMVGNLHETIDDIEKSFDLMEELKPDYVQWSVCSPYPGTPLYELGLKNGVIKSDVWREFARDPLVPFDSPVWTEYFSKEELITIVSRAYKQFYMRPRFIMKQLFNIRSMAQLKTMLSGALGMLK